ncbi:MAG: VIT1/CCC1 transporter family protein [Actinomycetes bacterium]
MADRGSHAEEHRDIAGGGSRAAMFGISDGLVTNVSLILGFAGAHPDPSVVRLAGIAGLVAGAFSMASGEYLSMQAQRELFERELAVERKALEESPEHELSELAAIYRSKGVAPDLAEDLARSMMRSPELALETHAREELGIDPTAIGSAWRASWVSFVTFALGALLPLLPWLWTGGPVAVIGSVVIGVVAAFAVGATLGRFTGRSKIRSGLRQTAVAALAASVTYGVGGLVGT